MKIVLAISMFIGGFVFCIGLFAVGSFDVFDGRPGTMDDPVLSIPTYLSFVGVMLTAVTAVITALGLGIAILAAYSFKEITAKAVFAAVAAATEITNKTSIGLQLTYEERLSEQNINALMLKIVANKQTPTLREMESEKYGSDDLEER